MFNENKRIFNEALEKKYISTDTRIAGPNEINS